MKYEILDVIGLAKNYAALGWVVVCDGDTHTQNALTLQVLRSRKMSNKNEVFEYLIDQLRQQLTNNPYKQQCEDLAHEAQSLKNQLRDMSEVVDELMGTITLMNGKSSCRKEDAQECEHDWLHSKHKSGFVCFKCGAREECDHDWVLDEKGDYFVCAKCGEQEAELVDCQHINTVGLRKGFAPGFTKKCLDCGAKLK